MTQLYEKEKDLNHQLLNSANGEGDDTGDEGDDPDSVNPQVRVSNNATE